MALQSILMLAALTTWAHFSISTRSICASFSGEVGMASAPASNRRCFTSGWVMTFCRSALILSTMSRGVPLGATSAAQE
jgi:hypothetical protein